MKVYVDALTILYVDAVVACIPYSLAYLSVTQVYSKVQ